jgi:hypothetical protein
MVEYLKTKKGYFYKLLKNGEKKRISREEYIKKIKKIGGGGERIEDEDIMYKDDLVCILKPNVKKGIIVWHKQPTEMESLLISGLKTGKRLQEEGIEFGRTKIHPYIFFRAPYYSNPINYATVKTEIESSYGEGELGTEPRIFIRVDPDRTFVFSSEIRVNFKTDAEQSKYLDKSKKTLSAYLEIIKDNLRIENNIIPQGNIRTYNLITGKARLSSIISDQLTFSVAPTNRNSEILVSISHLTPNYFVSLDA